jgi:NitT/TauT family transport system permease protein
VVAELVAAQSGLSFRIVTAQRFPRTDEIFEGIILIGSIGLAIDCVLKLIFRLVVPWAVNNT